MITAILAGLVVFFAGLALGLWEEREYLKYRAVRAEKDALDAAALAEERLLQNSRLLARLGEKPNLPVSHQAHLN